METREQRVIDAASKSTSPGAGPGGLGVIGTFQAFASTMRYDRQLTRLAEQHVGATVYGRLSGGPGPQSFPALTKGLSHDFPLELQLLVEERAAALDANIHNVAEIAYREILDEVDLVQTKVQDGRDESVDLRERLRQAQEPGADGDLPQPESAPLIARRLSTARALRYAYWALRRFKMLLFLVGLIIVGALLLESLLVSATMWPVLEGTAGSTGTMLRIQAAVFTIVVVCLGHGLWSKNLDVRVFSALALFGMTVALALIRIGVLKHETQLDSTNNLSTWALLSMMSLSSLVLAVAGGAATRWGHRIYIKSGQVRDQISEDVAQMQADLEGHQIARREEERVRTSRSKLVPQLERRIERVEANMRGEIARIRRMIRRRITRAVRQHLKPDIHNMARQLARWRHDPKSAPRSPRVTNSLRGGAIIGLTLWGVAACAAPGSQSEHVLLDTSGSVETELAERMRKKIVGHALRWVDSARPGDTFTIWWLEPEGSVYPAKRHRLTMPTLAIPAYAAREKFATSAVTEVEGVFKRLPHNVSRTRILDSVAYIGGTSAGYWSLSIYSDLQEDSPGWDDRDVLGEDDATLLQFMLAVCPAVRHPPTEVALISWPGRPPGTLDAVSLHRRYRDLFAEFFSRWAPEATIRIESI